MSRTCGEWRRSYAWREASSREATCEASLVGDAELHGNSLVGVPDHTPLRPADPDTLADRGSRLKLEGGAAQAWSAPDWLRQAM